jgi:hypothetical protein
LFAQVTVTNSSIKNNNILITNNTIAFSNSDPSLTISLKTLLETSDNSVNNTFGNLFLYYKKSENDSPTQVAFQSITFVNNYPKNNYISEASFSSIILYKKDFFAKGGFVYAEYKNNNNKTFQSSKIPVINGTMTTPTIPTIPPQTTNIYVTTQNIKYSDNFPIVNYKIPTTDYNSTLIDVDVYLKNNNGESINTNIYLRRELINSVTVGDNNSNMIVLKSVSVNGTFDNYLQINDIEINPINLDYTKYTYTLKIDITKYSINGSIIGFGNDYIRKDNKPLNTILAKPIINNTLSDNQSLISGQLSKLFITGNSPWVDFSLPCDNRRGSCPTDYRPVTIFKWQTRTQNSNWTEIPGATLIDYSPNKTFSENTYYRRVAFYDNGQYSFSNTINIIVSKIESTICCSQNLSSSNSQPQAFNGNIPNVSNEFSYQWQISSNDTGVTPTFWTNLDGVINQNYTHVFTMPASRGTTKTSFRRLIIQNNLVISNGNEIVVNRPDVYSENPGTGTIGRRSARLVTNDENETILTAKNQESLYSNLTTDNLQNINNNSLAIDSNLSLYPNPITNNFYIQNINKFKNPEKIKLYDSSGNEIKIDKTIHSDNLIEISTYSTLPGIYIVHINEDTLVTKKLIKN